MDSITPFFSLKFVNYFQKDANHHDFNEALDESRRTEVFYLYKDAIKGIG
jgi:hypothetical protein